MTSVVSGGNAERMAARIFTSMARAGSGVAARYSSKFVGEVFLFAMGWAAEGLFVFMRRMLSGSASLLKCLRGRILKHEVLDEGFVPLHGAAKAFAEVDCGS